MKQNEPISPHMFGHQKFDGWIVIIICIALLIRLAWLIYTNYTEEDAFITFRFARQLAEGHGFAFNVGEPIYGTTTPLLTLLLMGWYNLVPGNIVLGAKLFDLLASVGAMFFLWRALHMLGQTWINQILPLTIIAVSPKLWLMDTSGMETPLVLFFMTSSWYVWIKRKIGWTGLLLGLLLLTRIDLFPWAVILILAEWVSSPKDALRLAILTSITYLPWLVFSTFYFDSPIPHTISAKWVAYSKFNTSPLIPHLILFAQYLSPFDIPRRSDQSEWITFLSNLFAVITIGLAIWQTFRQWRDLRMTVLPAFGLFEIIRLTLTRETFFNRYFIPTFWVVLILVGLALGTVWSLLAQSKRKTIFLALVPLGIVSIFLLGLPRAQEVRFNQAFRNEASLKAIGIWLYQNTPPQATVQLEPLGYVGYYSDRYIIDEVGLVTPRVTKLKEERLDPNLYFSIFQPDYLVIHCDDALRLQGQQFVDQSTNIAVHYQLVKSFNPLNFDPLAAKTVLVNGTHPRSACYEIWQRIEKQRPN